MYLWSIDIDAVLVAMSCFALLCEEADIRCVWDEVTATVTYLLPNYHVYQELAAASTILTTGMNLFYSNVHKCFLNMNISSLGNHMEMLMNP